MAEEGARFVNIWENDTIAFVDQMKNTNTKRKTESDIKILKEWLATVGELRNPEDISIEELNTYLARFFLSVRTKTKEDYEPDSLKCIQASISRYMNEKKNINIMKGKEFAHSRDVLAAKRKELKGNGLGNKKRRADPFTADEIEMLYSKNLLGTSNPEALVNTVWLNNCIHFGMRGRQEHTDMCFGDVQMKATSDGKQYLEYCERETKTRKGDSGNTRAFSPKMFENRGDPRCPVATFKEFIQRRPVDMLTPESRMYLSKLNSIAADSINPPIRAVWFSTQPMGKNKLGDIAKTMSEKAGLMGRKVNHSARKTTVTSLLHSNVEGTQIMQLTGHCNIQSINQYSTASLNQQENMSSISSDITSGNRGSATNITVNTPQPSTSTQIVTEPSSDDELANGDVDELVAQIESYENSTTARSDTVHVQPTVIDLANCQALPTSKICLFPYAKLGGNVTVNFYGMNEKH